MLVTLEYRFDSLKEAAYVFNEIPTWIKDQRNIDMDFIKCGPDHIAYWIVRFSFEAKSVIDIECGEHIPPEQKFDLLIETHTHDQQ